jgi:hypothetical protein
MNGSRKCDVYTYTYTYNGVLLSHKEEWHHLLNVIEGHHGKWCKSGSERQRPHIFSHMWEIDLKDKYIHENKHDHIQMYM